MRTFEKCQEYVINHAWWECGDYMYFSDNWIRGEYSPCCCVKKGHDCEKKASHEGHTIYVKQGATPRPTPASDWVLYATSAHCERSGRYTDANNIICTDTEVPLAKCKSLVLNEWKSDCGKFMMYNDAPSSTGYQCCCVVKGGICKERPGHAGRSIWWNQANPE